MLFGITLARWAAPLKKWKMAVGDNMVLSCLLTTPKQFDGSDWPGGKPPLLAMFRPPKGAGRWELLAAEPTPENPNPKKQDFKKLDLEAMPLFGGKAYIFVTDNYDRPTRYIVRCHKGGRVEDSDIMLSKIDKGPTPFSQEFVSVDPGAPVEFTWPDPPNKDHWIHFLVVAEGEELLTGVYTRRTAWQYPRVSDLPYYIHDPMKAPKMRKGKTYYMMYHAVDSDAWVTQLCERTFTCR